MRIEYTYKAGAGWSRVAQDLCSLITMGAAAIPILAESVAGLTSVVGEPVGWGGNGMQIDRVDSASGKTLLYEFGTATGAAVDGVFAYALEPENSSTVPVYALFCGQNSATGGAAAAQGVIRMAVTENAVIISFPYGAGRQIALLGEADGGYFGAGAYPSHFVMSSQAVVSGLGNDAVSKVPYFPRVKNPAAAGDKVGLNACGLAFAVGISATNGWVYGINEALVYQGLPLEVFSNPKAAHLGFVRDVVLAPCKNVANDDFLVIAGERYIVYRENQTAALALAVKA